MKYSTKKIQILLTLAALLSIISACERVPTAAFRYTPTENLEIGDTIFFINESLDATSYEWDFGNGLTSSEAEPAIIYDYADYYKVYLNAINKAGNDTISQVLDINQATSLGFFVFLPDSINMLEGCNVSVYDNEEDMVNEAEPLFSAQTDADGIAFFEKMEPIVYYVSFYMETSEGIYWRRGYTTPLTPYSINLYAIVIKFTASGDLKTLQGSVNLRTGTSLLPETESSLLKR